MRGIDGVSAERSRLDPEPVGRRDFLGLAAVGSAVSALLMAAVGALRLPKAAVLPSPSKRFRVALPESMAPGEVFIPPGRSVALVRDEAGVYAVSLVCTHLGCIVQPRAESFDCPCHGSRFAQDGTVLRGPAPVALPWLEVVALGGREVLVDEGKTVPQGTRMEV
jgi:cytochrome b6-f complex iron-sulfur subunit